MADTYDPASPTEEKVLKSVVPPELDLSDVPLPDFPPPAVSRSTSQPETPSKHTVSRKNEESLIKTYGFSESRVPVVNIVRLEDLAIPTNMGNRSKHKRKKKRKRRGMGTSPELETDTSQLSPIPLPDDPPQQAVLKTDSVELDNSVSLSNSTKQSSTSQSECVTAESESRDSVNVEDSVNEMDTSDVDPIQSTKMKLLQKISMKQKGQSSQTPSNLSMVNEPVVPQTRSLYKAASKTITNEPKEKGKVQFTLRSSQKVFQANPLSELESETSENVDIENTATEMANKNISNMPVQDLVSKSEEYNEMIKTPVSFNVDNTVLPEDRIDHKDKEELPQNKARKKEKKRESQRRSRRLNTEKQLIHDGSEEISNNDTKDDEYSDNLASETVNEEKQHGRRSSRWSTRSKRLSEDDLKEKDNESSKKSRLRSLRYVESAVETYEIENVENSPTLYINKDSCEEKIVKPIKIRKRWSLRSQGSVDTDQKESEHVSTKSETKYDIVRDVETTNSDGKVLTVENVSITEKEIEKSSDIQKQLEKKNEVTNERVTRSSRTKGEEEIETTHSSKTNSEKSENGEKSEIIVSEQTNLQNMDDNKKSEPDLLVSKDYNETAQASKFFSEEDKTPKMSGIVYDKECKDESQEIDTRLKEKAQNDKETKSEKAHQKDEGSAEYKTTWENKYMEQILPSDDSQNDQGKIETKTIVDEVTKVGDGMKEIDSCKNQNYASISNDENEQYGKSEKSINTPDKAGSHEKDGGITKKSKVERCDDFKEGQTGTGRGEDWRSPDRFKSDRSRDRKHSDKSGDYEDRYGYDSKNEPDQHHDGGEKNESGDSKSIESFSSNLYKETFKSKSNLKSSKARSRVSVDKVSNKSDSNLSKIDNEGAVELNLDTLVPQKSKWEEDDSSSDYLDSQTDLELQKKKSGKSRETLEIMPGIEEKKSSFLGIKLVHSKDEKRKEDKSKSKTDRYGDKKERAKSGPLDPLINVDAKGAGALKNIMCAYSDSEEDEKEQVVQAEYTKDKTKHEKEEMSESYRKKYGGAEYKNVRSDRKYSEFDKQLDRSYKTSQSRERSPKDEFGSYKSSDSSDRDRYGDRYSRDEKMRDGDNYSDRFGRDEKLRNSEKFSDRYGRDEKTREKYEEGYSHRKKFRKKDDDYDEEDNWFSDNNKSKQSKERENRSKDRYVGDYDKDYETPQAN
ncbi:hypothetical protein KUTeg_002499 [Tegillarca granosa]|uniref:Uncharacterized protein n=1 Tax=Tegillarca granosa TaxID=220873 RepID=A0ABQ9FVT7_TEGGR|nr:hypothetical protein KUTeg_002499 [Tegillarca granosa]